MVEAGPPATVDRRRERGERTRRAILGRAARLASAEGLEAVSLQRLADELEISKSGLFAHFGSKEELQLATIEEAAGDSRRGVDPDQLAWELDWILVGANLTFLREGDGLVFQRARRAVRDRLVAVATPRAAGLPRRFTR